MGIKSILSISLTLLLVNSSSAYKLVKLKTNFSNDIEDVIISKNRVLLATEGYYIFYSDDWCKTWKSFEVPYTYDGDALDFFKASNGSLIVSGGLYDDHFISVSHDNGSTWVREWKDEDMEIGCFVEASNGAIFGFGDEDEYVKSYPPYIEWEELDRPWLNEIAIYDDEDVRCAINISKNRALLVGDDGLIMCLDENFKRIIFANKSINESLDFKSLTMVNDSLILAGTSKGSIFSSRDQGRNWKLQFKGPENSSNDVEKIVFSPEGVGIAVGESGLMLISRNFGLKWEKFDSGTDERFNSAVFIGNKTFLIVGDEGTIYKLIAS